MWLNKRLASGIIAIIAGVPGRGKLFVGGKREFLFREHVLTRQGRQLRIRVHRENVLSAECLTPRIAFSAAFA